MTEKETNTDNYVYLFVNEAIPEAIKIGISNDVPERIQQGNTWTPGAFSAVFVIKALHHDKMSAKRIENFTHEQFKDNCIGGEFYNIEIKEVKKYLRKFFIKTGDAIEEDIDKINKKAQQRNKNTQPYQPPTNPVIKERKINTTFKMIGVEPGTALALRSDPSKICTTADDTNTVIYNGENRNISNLATELLEYQANGFLSFSIEGSPKSLFNMREDMLETTQEDT